MVVVRRVIGSAILLSGMVIFASDVGALAARNSHPPSLSVADMAVSSLKN